MERLIRKLILGSVFLSTLCFGLGVVQFGNGSTSSSSSSNSGYNSYSGRTYQYDMTNHIDRQRYSTDTSAQKRDMSADGYVDRTRDRLKGQYGGGMYGN